MSISNLNVKHSADKMKTGVDATGTGAPAAADNFVTDTFKYPIGSTYFDLTARILYVRNAANKVTADFCASAVFYTKFIKLKGSLRAA